MISISCITVKFSEMVVFKSLKAQIWCFPSLKETISVEPSTNSLKFSNSDLNFNSLKL